MTSFLHNFDPYRGEEWVSSKTNTPFNLLEPVSGSRNVFISLIELAIWSVSVHGTSFDAFTEEVYKRAGHRVRGVVTRLLPAFLYALGSTTDELVLASITRKVIERARAWGESSSIPTSWSASRAWSARDRSRTLIESRVVRAGTIVRSVETARARVESSLLDEKFEPTPAMRIERTTWTVIAIDTGDVLGATDFMHYLSSTPHPAFERAHTRDLALFVDRSSRHLVPFAIEDERVILVARSKPDIPVVGIREGNTWTFTGPEDVQVDVRDWVSSALDVDVAYERVIGDELDLFIPMPTNTPYNPEVFRDVMMQPPFVQIIALHENARSYTRTRSFLATFVETFAVRITARYDSGLLGFSFRTNVMSPRAIDTLQVVCQGLVSVYANTFDQIVREYTDLSVSIRDPDRERVVPLRQGGKVYLKDELGEVFVRGYPRICAHPPRIVPDEASAAHTLLFPKSGKQSRYYACDHHKNHPFPGVLTNTLSNRRAYPYLPCCYKSDQRDLTNRPTYRYLNDLPPPRTGAGIRGARTLKPLDVGTEGPLPSALNLVAAATSMMRKSGASHRWTRVGIQDGQRAPDNAIVVDGEGRVFLGNALDSHEFAPVARTIPKRQVVFKNDYASEPSFELVLLRQDEKSDPISNFISTPPETALPPLALILLKRYAYVTNTPFLADPWISNLQPIQQATYGSGVIALLLQTRVLIFTEHLLEPFAGVEKVTASTAVREWAKELMGVIPDASDLYGAPPRGEDGILQTIPRCITVSGAELSSMLPDRYLSFAMQEWGIDYESTVRARDAVNSPVN